MTDVPASDENREASVASDHASSVAISAGVVKDKSSDRCSSDSCIEDASQGSSLASLGDSTGGDANEAADGAAHGSCSSSPLGPSGKSGVDAIEAAAHGSMAGSWSGADDEFSPLLADANGSTMR